MAFGTWCFSRPCKPLFVKKYICNKVALYSWQCCGERRIHKDLAISVIIPTYNRAELLFHCLQALECQQLPPSESFEVVVVDDSSTDGTPILVEEWKKYFSHVRLLRLSHNVGPGRARNAGVIVSLGRLLVFVDSDVIVKPGFLFAHWKKHLSSSHCISVGPVYWINDISLQTSHRFQWWTDASRAYFCTSNAAVEKQLFMKSGMFDADFVKYGWEDLELGERLRNTRRYFVQQAIAYHWKPPLTVSDLEKSIEQEKQRGEMGVS